MPACWAAWTSSTASCGLVRNPGSRSPARQPRRRRVGHGVHRPIAALVGPQAGHRDDAVVDLADRAEILAGHMGGGGAVLAVAGVVDAPARPASWGAVAGSSHNSCTRRSLTTLVVPGRLREEPLQPLDLAVLGPGDRLGPGQPGQGLVAIPRQQQPLQVVTQAAALGQAREQGVEPLGVVLQRAGRGRARTAGCSSAVVGSWQADRTMDRTAEAYPNLNKLPLKGLGCRVEGRGVELELGCRPGEDPAHANCPSPPRGTTRT